MSQTLPISSPMRSPMQPAMFSPFDSQIAGTGGGVGSPDPDPSLDFSLANNSQYLALLMDD
jgi:hypothetical protein